MSKPWLPPDDNAVKWEGTPSISAAASKLLVSIALIVIGVGAIQYGYLTSAGILTIIVVGVIVGGYGIVKVLQVEYVITEKSVWKRKSLLGTDTTRVKIPDVQNTSYSKPVTGTVTGRGDVVIEIAGGDNITFYRVKNYDTAHTLLSELVTGTQSDDIPGTIDQWRAIRDEVKRIRSDLQENQ